MADYENPRVPEGINISPTHPLREFALLLAGISALLIVVVLGLSLLAGYLVRFVPFAQEKALLSGLAASWLKDPTSPAEMSRQQYLQALAERLAKNMDLPQGMSISVHYMAGDTVNAMATLGGNVIVFQGLIDSMDSENALAMVLAHEIAHIRHRHPMVAIGRGFTVALALSSLAGIGDGLMQEWLGQMGMLSVLSFSRAQESAADVDALQALQRAYGHVGGAADFFKYVAARQPGLEPPALFGTHPGNDERIERIEGYAKVHAADQQQPLKALPGFLKGQPLAPADDTE